MGSAANQSETFAASEFRFAIVAARYNDDIVEALLDAARAAWRKHGGTDAALQVEHVPGATHANLFGHLSGPFSGGDL